MILFMLRQVERGVRDRGREPSLFFVSVVYGISIVIDFGHVIRVESAGEKVRGIEKERRWRERTFC